MPDMESYSLAKGLARIHLVITRAMEVARERSRAYASGEPAQPMEVIGFADYLQALTAVLHAHHTGEDEIAFPALRNRFPEAPVDLLAEEHRAVAPLLARLEALAADARHDASPEAWAAVAGTLDQLAALWAPHFKREEEHFSVAAVDRAVPGEEQATLVEKMVAHSQQHSGPDYLVVPFLLYNLDGDDRRAMGGLFPPIVTGQLVPSWQEKWSPMKPFLLA